MSKEDKMNKFFFMIAVLVSGCATEQPQPRNQQTHSGGERTMIKPSVCEIGDQKITGLTQEECLKRGETKTTALCSVGEKLQANAETKEIACLNTSTGYRRMLKGSEVCSQKEKLQHNPSTKQVACFNPETGERRFL